MCESVVGVIGSGQEILILLCFKSVSQFCLFFCLFVWITINYG